MKSKPTPQNHLISATLMALGFSGRLRRKRLGKGRYQVGATIIIRNDPPKHTGHHLVTTWRDQRTNEMLGYTLSEAVSLISKRA